MDGPSCPPLPELNWARDALFLDIDGTIIDIARTPEAVIVPESLKLDLIRVRDLLGGALALVSGRTLAGIDLLFGPLKFAAAGAHGAEIRSAPHGPVEGCARLLTTAERSALSEVARLDPRLLVEDKGYSLAIHYRSAPELEDQVIGAVRDNVTELGGTLLRVLLGKAVVEVKPHGFDKGSGLRALMRRSPFEGRRPIYLGDDVTDEDALGALAEFGGLGISVGRLLPGATLVAESPAQVRAWLGSLASPRPPS